MPVSFRNRSVVGALVGTFALCSGALCSGAQAATLTLTRTMEISPTPTFAMNKFDPSLGTLVSVSIGLTGGDFNYTTSVYRNNGSQTQTGTATVVPRALIGGSIFAGDGLDADANVGPSVAVPYSVQPFSVAPQDTFGYSGASTNDFSLLTATATHPAVLAAYTGTGTINLHAAFAGTVTFAPDSGPSTMQPYGSLGGQITGEDFTASVTYTYTPVPEPTAASLLALAALGTLRRYRRKG